MAPPCRAPVSPELRFGFAGAKPKLGVRWVAHFQLILLRVRLCLWLADGCGHPPATASSHQKVFTSKTICLYRCVRPRAASTIKKSRAAACRASCVCRFKTNRQNFGWGQNFAQKKLVLRSSTIVSLVKSVGGNRKSKMSGDKKGIGQ